MLMSAGLISEREGTKVGVGWPTFKAFDESEERRDDGRSFTL